MPWAQLLVPNGLLLLVITQPAPASVVTSSNPPVRLVNWARVAGTKHVENPKTHNPASKNFPISGGSLLASRNYKKQCNSQKKPDTNLFRSCGYNSTPSPPIV